MQILQAYLSLCLPWKLLEAWKVLLCVCVIMAANVLELATTLENLGAKWLPKKELILRPD